MEYYPDLLFRELFTKKMKFKISKVEQHNSVEIQIKNVRSIFLFLNLNFKKLYKDFYISHFLKITYVKTYEFIDSINNITELLLPYCKNENERRKTRKYNRIVINNIIKFKKLCLNQYIDDYGSLPGFLPKEIKKEIMSYNCLLESRN